MSNDPIKPAWLESQISRRRFLKYAGALGGATLLGGGLGSILEACSSPASPSGSGGPQGGKIVLNHWYHQYGEDGTLDAVTRYAAEYAKVNPNVDVKISWIPGDYYGKLNTALLGSDAPDIYETEFITPGAVKAGQLLAVDDLLTPDVLAGFGPTEHDGFTFGGKIYAVKFLDDIGLMYYRKSALQKVGVSTIPETFEDLIALTQKLTTSSMKGLFLGNDGGVAYGQYAVQSAGIKLFVDSNNKIAYDDDRTVLALNEMRQLNTNGSLLLDAPTDWADPGSFIDGLTAIQYSGLWIMPAVIKALGDDFLVGPWPKVGAAGSPTTFLGGYGEAINGGSKHIAEAEAYVKWLWLDNAADQQDFNVSYGFHIPPRKSVQAAATVLKSGQPAAAVDIATKYGVAQFQALYTPAVAQPFQDAVKSVIRDGADAKSTIHEAAALSQTQLDNIVKG
jgi:multiple sugar transport system substrate-binding protein